MSARDPGRMVYPQTYPQPMPRCAREGCGDPFTAHDIDDRKPHGRGRCSRWGRRVKCTCTGYVHPERCSDG